MIAACDVVRELPSELKCESTLCKTTQNAWFNKSDEVYALTRSSNAACTTAGPGCCERPQLIQTELHR